MGMPRVQITIGRFMLVGVAVGVLLCIPEWMAPIGEQVLWEEGGRQWARTTYRGCVFFQTSRPVGLGDSRSDLGRHLAESIPPWKLGRHHCFRRRPGVLADAQ